jgi:hypothetical protein
VAQSSWGGAAPSVNVKLLFYLDKSLLKTRGSGETNADVSPLLVVFNIVLAVGLLEILSEVELRGKNSLSCALVEPFDTFAVLPEATLGLLPRDDVYTQAVLFASVPHSLILTKVGPSIDPVAVLLVIAVLAFVSPPILPSVNAETLHVVIEPFALELATIEPFVSAKAANLVLEPLALVVRAIVPRVDAESMFLSCEVLALVD